MTLHWSFWTYIDILDPSLVFLNLPNLLYPSLIFLTLHSSSCPYNDLLEPSLIFLTLHKSSWPYADTNPIFLTKGRPPSLPVPPAGAGWPPALSASRHSSPGEWQHWKTATDQLTKSCKIITSQTDRQTWPEGKPTLAEVKWGEQRRDET